MKSQRAIATNLSMQSARGRVRLRKYSTEFAVARNLAAVLVASCLTVGCWAPPTIAGPDRLYDTDVETGSLQTFTNVTGANWSQYLHAPKDDRMGFRNEIMAARMYAIDVNYTKFEHEVSIEGQSVEFWSKLGSNSLTAATAAVPAASTVRQLNAIATGFNLASSSYTDAFFRKQLIENLVAAMRAARHERRAVIRSRMSCPTLYYPFGLAMSDVESYFRAGSLESGILRLTQTITAEEKKTKGSDDVAGPTSTPKARQTHKVAVQAAAAADADKGDKSACGSSLIASILQETDGDSRFSSHSASRLAARKPAAVPASLSATSPTQTAGNRPESAPDVQ
jgi:hypothetical protein